ncbi:MAG: formate/nitrite transporter family protein [Clostridia bacterium]|nr:formate/nitrite transporter family protein [Clostridia bacterium]
MTERITRSVASGFLVGIGVVINTLAPNPIVGSMLFSVALLAIIKNQLLLYTGKIGFIKEVPIKDLAIMYIGNLIGIIIPVFMVITQKEAAYAAMLQSSVNKFANGYLALLFYGMLCGVLMFLAVLSKDTVITVFCIMTFILSGYEHCIADFPYLLINFSWVNLLKFLCITLGNSLGSIGFYFLVQKYDKQKAA